MVQVLPPVAPKRNIWGEIGAGLGSGLGEGFEKGKQSAIERELLGQQQKNQEMQQQALSALLGPEYARLSPELQKLAAKEKFKSQSQLDLMRQLGLDFTPGEEFKPQFQPSITPSKEEIADFEEESPSKGISRPNLIPQSRIDKMSLVNPQLANQWQKANEEKLRQYRLDQKLATQERLESDKAVRESYKQNQKFIDKVQNDYESTLRKEAIFDRMKQLEESGQLSDSGTINFLHQLGLRDEWLKNPSNEEYNKLSLDLLGGGTLQSDYGSRILASEFKVSQQRIPSLSQTPEGRRQIRENLETMLLPNKLKEERLNYYLDKSEKTGKPLPHNLNGKILKDIRPQLEAAYDKFKQRNGRYKVKEGTLPDDNAIEKYYYIADGDVNKADKMMEEDGYDTGKESNKPSRSRGISKGTSRIFPRRRAGISSGI